MTDQDQIVALAELDGLEPTFVTGTNDIVYWNDPKENARLITWRELPNWLNSRDAIVPLIEKFVNTNTDYLKHSFILHLAKIACGKCEWYDAVKDAIKFVLPTPKQLCEAILRATGKWKET